jgi:hypothetical protein
VVEGCLIDASRFRGRAQWRSIVVAPEDQIAVGQTKSSAFRAEARPRGYRITHGHRNSAQRRSHRLPPCGLNRRTTQARAGERVCPASVPFG